MSPEPVGSSRAAPGAAVAQRPHLVSERCRSGEVRGNPIAGRAGHPARVAADHLGEKGELLRGQRRKLDVVVLDEGERERT